nr:hypothetical protein [Tanacetum cinerariifolium]GEV26179.1 hypothetical protein [Tanacetum cinerariifolium]
MVPYEAFTCRCGAGDVVLRESYKLKPMDLQHLQAIYRTFNISKIFSKTFKKCSAQTASTCLEITVLKATVEMYMHLKQHTLNSAALLFEVYNDMGKLGFE